jgi:hypothetical protein
MKRKTKEFEPLTVSGEVAERGINVLIRQAPGEYVSVPSFLVPEEVRSGDRISIRVETTIARESDDAGERESAQSESAQSE